MVPGAVARVRSFSTGSSVPAGRSAPLSTTRAKRLLPLGEARLLWEIGQERARPARPAIAARLDSGYLSRLLQLARGDGLVSVQPRVRPPRPHRASHPCRAPRSGTPRSSQRRAGTLVPRTTRQASRSSSSRRWPTSSGYFRRRSFEIDVVDPARPEAQSCLNAYLAELRRRFESGLRSPLSISAELHELRLPDGAFLLATVRFEPSARAR